MCVCVCVCVCRVYVRLLLLLVGAVADDGVCLCMGVSNAGSMLTSQWGDMTPRLSPSLSRLLFLVLRHVLFGTTST